VREDVLKGNDNDHGSKASKPVRAEARTIVEKETTMSNRVSVSFVDSDLLPSVPGLDPPTVQPHTYMLLDDDEKVCRVISEDELEESYVDNNIDTFKLQGVDWLTLDVDKESVDIKYFGGAKTSVLLGSISFGAGKRADQYAKKDGVIYPIDDFGTLLLSATNTPRLVAMRTWYHKEAKRVNDQRIEIAEMVHQFAHAIGHLGHTGHLGH